MRRATQAAAVACELGLVEDPSRQAGQDGKRVGAGVDDHADGEWAGARRSTW